MFGIRYCSKSNLHTAFYSLFFLEESHIEYRVFGIHPTTWCYPSCQNQTIPSSRTLGWSCPFLCSFSRLFRFFRLSPSIRCSYFAFSRLFFLCLLCTATGLCNGTKRAEFMGGRLPLCNCLQFGIHVGLLCVVLRVCRIAWLRPQPCNQFRSFSPSTLESPRFRSPKEEPAPTVLSLGAVAVERPDVADGQRGTVIKKVSQISDYTASQLAKPFFARYAMPASFLDL